MEIPAHNWDAVAALKTGADEYARKLKVTLEDIRGTGALSLEAIAKELNARHIQTRRGGKWHPSSVKNLLARLEAVA